MDLPQNSTTHVKVLLVGIIHRLLPGIFPSMLIMILSLYLVRTILDIFRGRDLHRRAYFSFDDNRIEGYRRRALQAIMIEESRLV